MTLDRFSLGQPAIGDLFLGVVALLDHTVMGHEPCLVEAEVLRGQLDQYSPGLSRCFSQGRTEEANASRTKSPHIPGTEIRISHDQVDRGQGHVEFLGQDLGQGGHNPLAHFDFSGKAAHPPVGCNPDKGVEIRWEPLAARRAPFLRRKYIIGEKNEEASTDPFQKLAAAQRKTVIVWGNLVFERSLFFHLRPPFISLAAV